MLIIDIKYLKEKESFVLLHISHFHLEINILTLYINSKHFTSVDYDASKHQHGLYLFKGKHFSENVDDEYENYDYLMGADLDYNNPEVVKEAIQWGLWYKDITRLDDFRCDAIKHIDSSFYEHWITIMRNHSKKELSLKKNSLQ